jgi:hypothetical protein
LPPLCGKARASVAGLYETAIDQLASRRIGEKRVRPKVVASTATVRRASDQIAALFDRPSTPVSSHHPALTGQTVFLRARYRPRRNPARLYLGIAAQGRGPKLVFLRALTTLLAAAKAEFDAQAAMSQSGKNSADPYISGRAAPTCGVFSGCFLGATDLDVAVGL